MLSGFDVGRAGCAVGGSPTVGFGGVPAGGATTAKVLDTTQGITVSAWVRLADGAVDRTVVIQQGVVESAFRLGHDAGTRRWTFALAEKDAANPARTVRSKARAVNLADSAGSGPPLRGRPRRRTASPPFPARKPTSVRLGGPNLGRFFVTTAKYGLRRSLHDGEQFVPAVS